MGEDGCRITAAKPHTELARQIAEEGMVLLECLRSDKLKKADLQACACRVLEMILKLA